MEVEVTTVSTGIKNSLIIEKNSGVMTEEEIQERLKELEKIKIHQRDRVENRLLIARGERIYEESLGEMRIYMADLIAKFESLLALQDDMNII